VIQVERPEESRPGALDKLYSNRVGPPKIPGEKERDAVIQRIVEHRQQVADEAANPPTGRDPVRLEDFKFPYERYGDREVSNALRLLFHGKCAYCESRYAGVQPMDVEHWRPKGEVVDETAGSIKPGYYWLAAEWDNLLPSCIDCNRARTQFDAMERKDIVLGKKNQFPVEDPGVRTKRHEEDPDFTGGSETPLLINPCLEDPEALLQYDEDGLILPKAQDSTSFAHRRAAASIRVYALNRADLVAERRALVLRLDHRLRMIDKLGEIRASLTDRQEAADALADLISGEIDLVLEMIEPNQPYAGLARQLIRDADALLRAAGPGPTN
jgi:uncharacterized protein (TIGR02646 family)